MAGDKLLGNWTQGLNIFGDVSGSFWNFFVSLFVSLFVLQFQNFSEQFRSAEVPQQVLNPTPLNPTPALQFSESCAAETALQHSLFCSADVVFTRSCAATNEKLHCNTEKAWRAG